MLRPNNVIMCLIFIGLLRGEVHRGKLCKSIKLCATRVMSDSPWLVDFAIRLVNSVLNLLDRQLKFLGEFK